MHARKTTHGLDGQHQDVDRTPRGRVSQNDRGQRMNGLRTAKEQNIILMFLIYSLMYSERFVLN